MRNQLFFTAVLATALALVWLFSGERFLDWVFLMPDIGSVDDFIIEAVIAAHDWKAGLNLADYFGETRSWLHEKLGLTQ